MSVYRMERTIYSCSSDNLYSAFPLLKQMPRVAYKIQAAILNPSKASKA